MRYMVEARRRLSVEARTALEKRIFYLTNVARSTMIAPMLQHSLWSSTNRDLAAKAMRSRICVPAYFEGQGISTG